MTDKIKGVLVAMAAVAALAAGGAAIAGAAGSDESAAGGDQPATSAQPATPESENDSDRNETDVAINNGSDLDKASAAALEHTGSGQVTETEVGDEESYYEVEVSQADGSQVDVQLDRDFAVVGSEADGQDG